MLPLSKIRELRTEYKALEGRIDCSEDIEAIEYDCMIHNISFDLITMSDEEFMDVESTIYSHWFN